MLITPSFKKSLIVEQFQGNYLKQASLSSHGRKSKANYFAYHDSDLSQIFKLIVSASENIVHNINVEV